MSGRKRRLTAGFGQMSDLTNRPTARRSSKDEQARLARRPVQFCQSIAPVRLYLDDIEQIVAYLQGLSPEIDLALVTPRHEVTTVEGLTGLDRQEVPALEIRCSVNPRRLYDLVVSIGPESVFLCRTGDTLAHKRAYLGIEALLLARRLRWQRRDRLLAAAALLGLLSSVLFVLARSSLSPWLSHLGVGLAALSLSLSATYPLTKRWSTSRIALIRRQDARVHWDYMTGAFIVLALISAMALVTLGSAFLVQFLDFPAP